MKHRILFAGFLFLTAFSSAFAQMPPREINQIRNETNQRNQDIENYDRQNGNGVVLPSLSGRFPNGKIPGSEIRKYVLAAQRETEVTILSVKSGDLMTVNDGANQIVVRLLGIDAPEEGQPSFEAAKKKLSDLVLGKKVILKYSLHNLKDESGYFPARVFINETDIGLDLLKTGFAWRNDEDEFFIEKTDDKLNAQMQAEAQTAKIGIWTEEKPVKPSKYRKQAEKLKNKTDKNKKADS